VAATAAPVEPKRPVRIEALAQRRAARVVEEGLRLRQHLVHAPDLDHDAGAFAEVIAKEVQGRIGFGVARLVGAVERCGVVAAVAHPLAGEHFQFEACHPRLGLAPVGNDEQGVRAGQHVHALGPTLHLDGDARRDRRPQRGEEHQDQEGAEVSGEVAALVASWTMACGRGH
jgi:hypothetical protein